MRAHYSELARFEREGFDVIVETTSEDSHPGDCFDDTCYDIGEIVRKINSGFYDWFILRVRVRLAGIDLAEEYCGGMLYEDAREVLTDGTAEDLILDGIADARTKALTLKWAFEKVLDTETV